MTDRYAVFGNPIAHSLSPQIHSYFATQTKQDLVYDRVLVPEGEFKATADKFFADGGCGCNVTVPCKLDAYSYADTLTEYAKAAGAVNTLKKLPDGSVLGDNTDGRGLVLDLLRTNCPLKGSRILIVGAGGAARGILKPIVEQLPQSVTIVNRTLAKAKNLASLYEGVEATDYSNLDGYFDVIINATSTSLEGKLPAISDSIYKNASFAYDLMYRKNENTVFVQKALDCGVKQVYDGFGMLVGQAILSFELWRENTHLNFNECLEYLK
ncbi:shikimate dehydrogenase [Succinivibrio sp.]|uniref:shikimate dehydrogenase n=1 Tax=Succinivibrio sp. TaxID=2053619 RepID=UPI003865ADCE